jgi:hypothetical protein
MQCAAMKIIGIELGNGLGNCRKIGIGNGLGNGLGILRNGIGTGNGIGNAIGKSLNWAHLIRGDPPCLIGSASLLLTVSFETDMIAILEEC